MNRGVCYGAAAYALWGLLPLYWKLLQFVPADQIIAHRIVWSFLLLVFVMIPRLRREHERRESGMSIAISSGVVLVYFTAAVLLALNWFIYVWAVNRGWIVEASLGYFITPLVNVLLGVTVLHERLRPMQWLAMGVATAGVAHLSFAYGAVPWIAVVLAVTFGTYGFVKKRAPYEAAAGLTLETGVLLLPAFIYLVVLEGRSAGAFGQAVAAERLLLAAAGVITTIPLLLFAAAVRRVPLAVIGILQYISPTLNLLLGVLVYREPFNRQQLVGFALVWAALIAFTVDSVVTRGQQPRAA